MIGSEGLNCTAAGKHVMKKPEDWTWGYWITLNVIGYIVLILFTYVVIWILKRG